MFQRDPHNPIIVPGLYPWRMAASFNPGVIYEDGRFFLYERPAGSLRPFHCCIGLLENQDGVHFTHVSDQPVFTPEMAGSRFGSVQDPRVVRIGVTYYMTYAFRPYTWSINPIGVGIFDGYEASFPGFDGDSRKNQTRTGIAVSDGRLHWSHLAWVNDPDVDDRDILLFPQKIGDAYAILRRPRKFVGAIQTQDDHPGIYLSYFAGFAHLVAAGTGHPTRVCLGRQPHWDVYPTGTNRPGLAGVLSRGRKPGSIPPVCLLPAGSDAAGPLKPRPGHRQDEGFPDGTGNLLRAV